MCRSLRANFCQCQGHTLHVLFSACQTEELESERGGAGCQEGRTPPASRKRGRGATGAGLFQFCRRPTAMPEHLSQSIC